MRRGVPARARLTCRSRSTTRPRRRSTARSDSVPRIATTTVHGRGRRDEAAGRRTVSPSALSVAALLDALRARGWRCATAESCTGGLVAAAITSVAGSSDVFDRGFVTYSNAAKVGMLGVDAALIIAHGAVSEPVARAMADGALAHSDAHVAVAITGIAGPGGAVPGKPVGTVCFGLAIRGHETVAETVRWPGDRAAVRAAAALHALERLAAAAAETS
ncbi:MAG: CinA family protein [Proteobacteria bacterium]|nr:CinA family protein [Pseudomonadota bacterium]